MNKRFVAADDLLRDSFQLAANIYKAGFRPDFLVGLWRGGSAVGIAVQEGLEHLGVETDHIAIRTSYSGAHRYSEMVSKADGIRVHGLQYLLENLSSHHSMLIVDDVYSTGSSVAAVIAQLARKNAPQSATGHSHSDRLLPADREDTAHTRVFRARDQRLARAAV